MVVVSIIAVIILILSLFNGFREGALKQAASIISLLAAIPLAGLCYHWLASLFSFMPGENFENFVGFFLTMGIIMVLIQLLLWLPRRHFAKSWKEELLLRSIGAVLSFFSAAIMIAVFAVVLNAYPIFDWLQSAVSGSGVINWLGSWLGFVQSMLPSVFG
ncbi:MAG: CvpA family protein [Dehalococcoidia bacterium]|nr:MAG: CvpA family protein [Dehalococcoidia bacterium]